MGARPFRKTAAQMALGCFDTSLVRCHLSSRVEFHYLSTARGHLSHLVLRVAPCLAARKSPRRGLVIGAPVAFHGPWIRSKVVTDQARRLPVALRARCQPARRSTRATPTRSLADPFLIASRCLHAGISFAASTADQFLRFNNCVDRFKRGRKRIDGHCRLTRC